MNARPGTAAAHPAAAPASAENALIFGFILFPRAPSGEKKRKEDALKQKINDSRAKIPALILQVA
ncbi:MAG: hypothetical protein IK118_04310 [Clostridia bacterium]|nr:hypothetical protein [Clostridia bacterium]